MLLRFLLAVLACLSLPVQGQGFATPTRFRLVMPHQPGSIVIDTSGGWKIERVLLTNGNRPVLQMQNESLGIVASYILDHDPPYYPTADSCRDDSLGTILRGPLAKAIVRERHNDSRRLKDGQTLLIGSYLIAKQEGISIQQENVLDF